MQFLFPNILYALLLALIPIILHLINLRKHKKMYFSSLWFLKNLKQQTSRSKKIYQWLLLLVRTLFIAALVTAFAGPIIKNNTSVENKTTHILLDNTFSLQSSNNKGNLYDQIKNKALEIVDNIDKSEPLSIHFIATGKSYYNKSQNEAQHIIQESKLQHGNTTINKIISKIHDRNTENRAIILSDFQTNILTNDTVLNDSSLSSSLVIFRGENTNISIDSIWFDKPMHVPNEESEISISLRNHSNKAVTDIPVQVFINDELTSVGSENIEGNATHTFKTKVQLNQTGFVKIRASAQDLPINFDNQYYAGIYLTSQYKIVEIADTASNYLKALFSEKEYFDFHSTSPTLVSLSRIQKANTIIINQPRNISSGILSAINKTVEQGCNLIIIPNQNTPVNILNEQISHFNLPEFNELKEEKTTIEQINLTHPIYSEAIEKIEKNIKLPTISKYFTINKRNRLTPLILNDFEEPLLLQGLAGDGNIYIFAFNPLNRSFALDPIFVPTIYNSSVITNRSLIPHLQCTNSGTIKINTIRQQDKNPIFIENEEKSFIPFQYTQEQSTVISIQKNQIDKPGYYKIRQQDSTINYLSINHIKGESQLQFYDEDLLKNQIFRNTNNTVFSASDSSEIILQPVKKLWKWFVLLAILMVILETLLLTLKKRVKKHS
jgi:hypothetical protein